ncbi:MAG: peptidyl-alpha-hydroxyglycine alpha-amidating lyase family protein, partial [Candidatus Acidiferrales bacterium]
DMPKSKPPQISYQVVPDFFKIPTGMIMAEAVGVAINSQGHIFLLNRGNHPLLEFTPDGSFVTSYGEGSPVFRIPHSIRFDSEDNLWYDSAGDNLVVKFDRNMRVVQALGRREGDMAWVYMTHGIERAIPGPSNFYQPTDTAVGPDGSTYVTDGYGNSRVVKFTREGNLVKYWGDRGTRTGQFNTPHNIVIDAKANLYVADRQNNRVQVFDTDGNFKQEWRLDGPAWSLCITPGPSQVIFVGSVGRIFKMDLNGKVLGTLGKLGRLPGWFDAIHSLACPDEKTLYLAEEFSFRFDKVVLE